MMWVCRLPAGSGTERLENGVATWWSSTNVAAVTNVHILLEEYENREKEVGEKLISNSLLIRLRKRDMNTSYRSTISELVTESNLVQTHVGWGFLADILDSMLYQIGVSKSIIYSNSH